MLDGSLNLSALVKLFPCLIRTPVRCFRQVGDRNLLLDQDSGRHSPLAILFLTGIGWNCDWGGWDEKLLVRRCVRVARELSLLSNATFALFKSFVVTESFDSS